VQPPGEFRALLERQLLNGLFDLFDAHVCEI
jgi:hypothetical protein